MTDNKSIFPIIEEGKTTRGGFMGLGMYQLKFDWVRWMQIFIARLIVYGVITLSMLPTSSGKNFNLVRRIKKFRHKEHFKKFTWNKQLKYVNRLKNEKLRETYSSIMIDQAQKIFARGALKFIRRSKYGLALINYRNDKGQTIETRKRSKKYRRLDRLYAKSNFMPPQALLAPMVTLAKGSGGMVESLINRISLSLDGFVEHEAGYGRSIDHEFRHYGVTQRDDEHPYYTTVGTNLSFGFKRGSLRELYTTAFRLDEINSYGRAGLRGDWLSAKDFRDQTEIIFEKLVTLKRTEGQNKIAPLTSQHSIINISGKNFIQLTIVGESLASAKTKELPWLSLERPYNERVASIIKNEHGGDVVSYFHSVVSEVMDDSYKMLVRKSRVLRRRQNEQKNEVANDES